MYVCMYACMYVKATQRFLKVQVTELHVFLSRLPESIRETMSINWRRALVQLFNTITTTGDPIRWIRLIKGRHEPRQWNMGNQGFLVRHYKSQLKQTQHDSEPSIFNGLIVERN